MGGRELRATLLFVLISLVVGAAYRSWSGPDGPTFVERLRALEESAGLGDERGDGAAALAGIEPDSSAGPRSPFERERSGSRPRARSDPPALGRLDPDRASVAEWERLPGIGPSLASRIAADRAANGPFGGPEGLLRVRGIGPRTLDRLRPFLRTAPVDSAPPFAN